MTHTDTVAIVFCLEQDADKVNVGSIPFGRVQNAFMQDLVDRPFLQHVIESICQLGIRKIYVFNASDPAGVRALLGDGTRWGCSIEHVLLQNAAQAPQKLASLGLDDETGLFIFDAHLFLPDSHALEGVLQKVPSQLGVDVQQSALPILVYGHGDDVPCCIWTTKAHAVSQFQMPAASTKLDMSDMTAWQAAVHDIPAQSVFSTVQSLSCLCGQELLEAQNKILTGQVKVLNSGFEIEPGVWMSRNVVLHPTVEVIAPVFFGPNCRIDAGAQIGPNVALAGGTRVGKEVTMQDCAVSRATWIGEGLNCEQLLIQQGEIWNARLGTALNIRDTFLLSAMQPAQSLGRLLLNTVAGFFARLCAALVWLPLWILAKLLTIKLPDGAANGSKVESASKQEVVYKRLGLAKLGQSGQALSKSGLPSRERSNPAGIWQDAVGVAYFTNWVCGGLGQVALGHWSWVGVRARSPQEFMALDSEWRSALDGANTGLFDVARLEFGVFAADWECRLSELYYLHQTHSPWRNLKLLLRSPRQVFSPRRD